MPDTETSLADQVTPTVDVTPQPLPEDFDMATFLEGVRPTRHAVQLFPQAHLIAHLEQLASQIDAAASDADVDALVDEFDQVRDQFRTGIWFTVEKRSSEWVDDFRETTAKSLGLKKVRDDDDNEAYVHADALKVSMHQLAAQIVEPAGVTHADLRRLLDNNEGELSKLLMVMNLVNTQLAESSEVLKRDFSRRRSASLTT